MSNENGSRRLSLSEPVLRALDMDEMDSDLVNEGNVAAHVYRLAHASSSDPLAGINLGWSDRKASTGFLVSLVASVDEMVSDGEFDSEAANDAIFEWADSAVPAYNSERIAAAEDLSAEVDDPGLLGDDFSLANVAGVALYCEATQILAALIGAVAEAIEEIADEAEDTEDEEETIPN